MAHFELNAHLSQIGKSTLPHFKQITQLQPIRMKSCQNKRRFR